MAHKGGPAAPGGYPSKKRSRASDRSTVQADLEELRKARDEDGHLHRALAAAQGFARLRRSLNTKRIAYAVGILQEAINGVLEYTGSERTDRRRRLLRAQQDLLRIGTEIRASQAIRSSNILGVELARRHRLGALRQKGQLGPQTAEALNRVHKHCVGRGSRSEDAWIYVGRLAVLAGLYKRAAGDDFTSLGDRVRKAVRRVARLGADAGTLRDWKEPIKASEARPPDAFDRRLWRSMMKKSASQRQD